MGKGDLQKESGPLNERKPNLCSRLSQRRAQGSVSESRSLKGKRGKSGWTHSSLPVGKSASQRANGGELMDGSWEEGLWTLKKEPQGKEAAKWLENAARWIGDGERDKTAGGRWPLNYYWLGHNAWMDQYKSPTGAGDDEELFRLAGF